MSLPLAAAGFIEYTVLQRFYPGQVGGELQGRQVRRRGKCLQCLNHIMVADPHHFNADLDQSFRLYGSVSYLSL